MRITRYWAGISLLLLLSCMVWLTACGDKKSSNADSSQASANQTEDTAPLAQEVKEGDFVYRLVAETAEDHSADSVKLYAELEYAGDQDEVTITHAMSPFYFPMKETTRGYDISYMMDQPLITTTLRKGEPLREQYRASGGYSADQDPKDYIEFIKDFTANGFLPGRYEVNGFADFNLLVGDKSEPYKLSATVVFTVK
ncbi:hypothetical protein DFQ01_11161 [Paenibacillus cellulosilyticus]|uniref:Uncharacterized protein n=1 Tax=Paenibacillus cellulosilyticus TaxID=375489 RepID=A0A2V2Z104_9BACL|nr:hypothetical protein [Paenibacillus cellulosilyticus]PWW00916.1 hypothetical protein DFQ01_11161 [Paenibacillus cellulosilyticus]QKS47571.1 hypothetical protein HUB94_24655 [Paenibacillus cellulosilyticus]